jgi:4-aminobutyrate aminotransferase-like enzyme/Ser/Thr protein kinase RdoA (MazF antagonist)
MTDPWLDIAIAIMRNDFGVEATTSALPGEYDRNVRIDATDGRAFVLKIMRKGCDAAFVDMQIAAIGHLRARGLGDRVPEVLASTSGKTQIHVLDPDGEARIAWAISLLPGQLMADIDPMTVHDTTSLGALLAAVDIGLEDFVHPLVNRSLKWNLIEAGWISKGLEVVPDATRRAMVAGIAQRFSDHLLPTLQALPAVPIHNDANDMNLLFAGVGDERHASALFDFGDMTAAPRVCEIGIAMAYAMMGAGDPIARGAALVAGYHAVTPLSAQEQRLAAHCAQMRLAVSVTNAAIEAQERPDMPYLQISAAPAWALLSHLDAVGVEHLSDEIERACAGGLARTVDPTIASLRARRRRITPGNQALFFDDPLHIVRGERHFLYAADGTQYLDVYNNVPHVGHANPHVNDAVARQMAMVTTNTRYLQEVHLTYAERFVARLPAELTRIIFVNSASEANEVALRLARAVTGARDMIVMEHCYHGMTTGAMDISPYKFNHPKSMSPKPDWVHVTSQPDPYRGAHGRDAAGYLSDLKSILDGLEAAGRKPAGFITECVPSVGGQVVLPTGYLTQAYAMVRAAGGVAIADDVQTALGRLGQYFWGFEEQGAVPDIAVFGKPLGNGFPLGAVAMTETIALAFEQGPEFFSTFGGSSAACAAGAAVLDVLDADCLPRNAKHTGDLLLDGFRDMAKRFDVIGDVRGYGLFLGIELVEDRQARTPATARASRIKNGLRNRHVLLGTEGPHDNVLKIRPPMTFDAAAADQLLTSIEAELKSL